MANASDIRVMVDFLDHPKTLRLRRVLSSPNAHDHLLRLWFWARVHRPDGDLIDCDNDAIADAARWDGGPAKVFIDALLDCRWIEWESGVGCWRLRNWKGHQGYALGSDRRSERARKGAIAKQLHAMGIQGTRGKSVAELEAMLVDDHGNPNTEEDPKSLLTAACKQKTAACKQKTAAPAPAPAPAPKEPRAESKQENPFSRTPEDVGRLKAIIDDVRDRLQPGVGRRPLDAPAPPRQAGTQPEGTQCVATADPTPATAMTACRPAAPSHEATTPTEAADRDSPIERARQRIVDALARHPAARSTLDATWGEVPGHEAPAVGVPEASDSEADQ